MYWVVVGLGLLLAAGIAVGVWELVGIMRHATAQNAAIFRLLEAIQEQIGTPAEHAKAHWRELDRIEAQSRRALTR